jgi:hypothetical protein
VGGTCYGQVAGGDDGRLNAYDLATGGGPKWRNGDTVDYEYAAAAITGL